VDDRRRAALAGHRRDETTARVLVADADPAVRATALGALARMGALSADDLAGAVHDPDPGVRRRACEEAGNHPALDVELVTLTDDRDPSVVEAACWALGERGDRAGAHAVDALATVATEHADPLCREAAVAALGAIGDPAGLHAILTATSDKPAVRRRAVLALAPFEGDDVDRALERALEDHDWQVRQAAEDLLS
jgi:HEAT repeat protein